MWELQWISGLAADENKEESSDEKKNKSKQTNKQTKQERSPLLGDFPCNGQLSTTKEVNTSMTDEVWGWGKM